MSTPITHATVVSSTSTASPAAIGEPSRVDPRASRSEIDIDGSVGRGARVTASPVALLPHRERRPRGSDQAEDDTGEGEGRDGCCRSRDTEQSQQGAAQHTAQTAAPAP
jgi:hypothetical protein